MADFNPIQLMQLKQKIDTFRAAHLKFPMFLKAVGDNALEEGTVVDFKVTSPDGREYSSNIKLTADDVEMLQQLKDTMTGGH